MRIFSTLLVLFVSFQTLSAQNAPLQFRTFTIVPEATQWDAIDQPSSGEIWDGFIYRIIQFAQVPDEAMHQRIRIEGVQLIDYVPQNAYIAAIPAGFQIRNLESFGVNAVLTMSSAMKLAPAVTKLPVPDYALDGKGQPMIQVAFHRNVSGESATAYLKNAGATVLNYSAEANLAEVSISIHDIPTLAEAPFIRFIDWVDAPGEPENYTAAHMHRSTYIASESHTGLKYDGRGVHVQMQDDGGIGPHIDYQGRIAEQFSTNFNPSNDHGDHVAGTIMGAGNLNPRNRGMATGATIYVYNYGSRNDSIRTHYHQYGLRITSTSYSNGCNAGYTTVTRKHDEEAALLPELIHVFSAGNSNGSNCNYGAGSQWGNVTGGHKVGKNVIATANLTINDVISSSSSRGPAHDGRIKPDISAKGSAVISTIPNNNYSSKSGTSMAAPGISGILAQLYHVFKDMNQGATPQSDIMKALILNTADDLGNTGPDFIYGWGRVNANRAYKVLESNQFQVDHVSQGQVKQIPLQIPAGVQEARIMIYWHDRHAIENANPALVNDLDMVVNFNLQSHLPWVLNHSPHVDSLSMPARKGRDSLNNVEQVVINNPAPGTYNLVVTGAKVPFGPQRFVVVYEWRGSEITVTHPAGGESFSPSQIEVARWDAMPDASSFLLQISPDSGQTWFAAGSAAGTADKANMTTISTPTGKALLRVIRGNDTAMSDNVFSIMSRPSNVTKTESCCDNIILTWDTAAQATGYVVYTLGAEYMEPRDTVTTNTYRLYGMKPDSSVWVSVKALGPNGAWSERTIAIEVTGGLAPCTMPGNLTMEAVINPGSGIVQSCISNYTVTVSIFNSTTDTLQNVPVAFTYANDTTIELIGSMLPQSSTQYTFNKAFNPAQGSQQQLTTWVAYALDLNHCDDTLTTTFYINPASVIRPIPYLENLETFNRCPVTTNCGGTNCPLSNGWINEQNGTYDIHDWRIHRGTTASANTGPSTDVNPGTSTGHYAYLEATTCFNSTASMLSPCIDLSNRTSPKLRFWYHMYGATTGTLQVDVRSASGWDDAVFFREGNQGNQWHQAIIDLAPYAGDTINLRFLGNTGTSFTSDIALDNFSFFEEGPLASAITGPEKVCINQFNVFNADMNDLEVSSYQWYYGDGSVPSSGTGSGPKTIRYDTPGPKLMQLIVSNGSRTDTIIRIIEVIDRPTAAFNATGQIQPLDVLFESNSTGADSVRWVFGDGNSGTSNAVLHSYPAFGEYEVMLIAFNACGSDTTIETIKVEPIGISRVEGGILSFSIVPNPSKGQFELIVSGNLQSGTVAISDVTGRLVWQQHGVSIQNSGVIPVDISGSAPGVYFVRLQSGNHFSTHPFVLSK